MDVQEKMLPVAAAHWARPNLHGSDEPLEELQLSSACELANLLVFGIAVCALLAAECA